jgi:hypothetical protein
MPVPTKSALDLDQVTEALKEHYKALTIKDMVYRDNPLLAMMPKYERFGGENMPIPLQYGITNRRSADFATGQGLISGTRLERFVIERVKDYSFARITGETIKATEGNADAFLKYATMEIDGAIKSLSRSLAVAMYGDGSGQIGLGPFASADNSITLAKPEQVTNFEVGMKCQFSTAATTAVVGLTDLTITAVNRDTGKLTFDGAGALVNGTSYYIFQIGDAQNGAASGVKISGLEAWIPGGTPSANFFGVVDRTVDRTRLAGVPFDGSSMPLEEALISAASRLAREGGSPNYCFLDYTQFANLEKALGSKVVYDKVSSDDADVGFQALSIIGPKGPIKIIADQNCTPDVAYLLQMDTWTLNSLGPAPHILDLDGNRMLRIHNDDSYELRVGFYGNVACTAPGYNCRIALA